ncbi:unnamed protein product [Gongylonema pulchrum]|uniref:Uncharacterized protein n=1 Tax=Gongylonema pulchrum TaxID=637853 RepID=A0A183EFX8_9BILA|nr:unnamed protein product [Gongylonema pulchrum]
MVTDLENVRQIIDSDGTDYDNLELTVAETMLFKASSPSSSSSSIATLKNDGNDDLETEMLEKISSHRSATATATCSSILQKQCVIGTCTGRDWGWIFNAKF